jgi:GT2 family glycosyltransferase
MTLHVIVVAYNRPMDLKRLIFDFLLQSVGNWKLHIVHDGPMLKEAVNFIKDLKDDRISLVITPKVNGFWGHPNRAMMLETIEGEDDDFVLITNDDNQYVKDFVKQFGKKCNKHSGMVYCNTVHNYLDYNVLNTEVKVGSIDMGSFIVRLELAKKVGFIHTVEVADGMYAEECAAECRRRKLMIVRINKPLFIHN